MIEIKEWITQERDAFKNMHIVGPGNGAWLMQEFLLRNGQRFASQPKPKRYRMRRPKACFANAARLAKKSKVLRYAEGYIASPDLPLLIHHAWCVDPRDRVVDVTLQNWRDGSSRSGEAQYYGIVFEKGSPIGTKPSGGSMLDSGRGFRIDLWLEIDPGFKEVIDGALRPVTN
jgi:hypothetical protein